jgi:tripartite-type tricarboxylate transporter receptor subunit TctC
MGQALSERLGQQLVIDNRPGAGNNIGSEVVVNSPRADAHGENKKIRLTEITVATENATAKGLKNRIFSPGQGRRGSWKP